MLEIITQSKLLEDKIHIDYIIKTDDVNILIILKRGIHEKILRLQNVLGGVKEGMHYHKTPEYLESEIELLQNYLKYLEEFFKI